jgi:hypothetical protein
LSVSDGFVTVLKENQRKNHVVNLLAEKIGVKPTDFGFAFDSNRVLNISHSELTPDVVQSVQEEIDKAHGLGKVTLHG